MNGYICSRTDARQAYIMTQARTVTPMKTFMAMVVYVLIILLQKPNKLLEAIIPSGHLYYARARHDGSDRDGGDMYYTRARHDELDRDGGDVMIERRRYLQEMCINNGMLPVSLDEQVRRTLDQPPYMSMVDDRHGLLYCPVLKAGSTTILRLLVNTSHIDDNIPPGKVLHGDDVLRANGITFLRDHDNPAIRERLEHYVRFTVVRHPLDRLHSAYVDKFTGSGKDHNWLPKFRKRMLKHVGENATWLKDPTGKDMASFSQFLTFVAKSPRNDYHWWDVSAYCLPCTYTYHYILKMETYERDINTLLHQFHDLNVDSLQRHNGYGPVNVTARYQQLIHAYRDVDNVTITSLINRYRLDFELFGYSWDDNGPGYSDTRPGV